MLIPTIGIEVHVELKSKTKVYSNSLNQYTSNPNSYVNVIDLGYPGVLPKLNKEVVDMALRAALAFNCKINTKMHFDRKNYFYPDLPKGYQITQNKTPIGYDGHIEIYVDGYTKKIGIERIHIEEDTCKSLHTGIGTLLNFNRAGVPLIEIVSKPDIVNEKEAVAYIEALREILLYLNISDVKIEEGSMRCDANVSLKEENATKLGTKTEIKNIGSITNVATSIKYEISRQKEILESGKNVTEETRRFDDKTNTTISMRVKETGNDYRYFPEPDLPYVIIDNEWLERAKSSLPVMPNDLRTKYRLLGINDNNIKTLLSNYDLCMFFEQVNSVTDPVVASNILTGDILSYLNKNNLSINNTSISNHDFIKLVDKLIKNEISSKQMKDIIPIILKDGLTVEEVITKLGISQISDDNLLKEVITKIINENPESVNDFKAGRDRALKYLMGQIMKETKGQANPKLVNDLLLEELSKQ